MTYTYAKKLKISKYFTHCWNLIKIYGFFFKARAIKSPGAII